MRNLENRNKTIMKMSFIAFLTIIISIPIGMLLRSHLIVTASLTLLGIYLMVPGFFLLFKPDISFYWYQGLKPWLPAYHWEKAGVMEKAFLYIGSSISFIFGVLVIAAVIFDI